MPVVGISRTCQTIAQTEIHVPLSPLAKEILRRYSNDQTNEPKRILGQLVGTVLLSALVACAPPQASYKPTGPDVVDVMVPYGSGGGTDTWARFITQSFADVNPDVKRSQVVNVPGGETITGANAYVKSGVTTGQYVMIASASTYFQDMLDHKAVQFDFTKLEPLAFNGTGGMVWTNGKTGIKTIHDAQKTTEPLLYGGMSASGLDLIALLALKAFIQHGHSCKRKNRKRPKFARCPYL